MLRTSLPVRNNEKNTTHKNFCLDGTCSQSQRETFWLRSSSLWVSKVNDEISWTLSSPLENFRPVYSRFPKQLGNIRADLGFGSTAIEILSKLMKRFSKCTVVMSVTPNAQSMYEEQWLRKVLKFIVTVAFLALFCFIFSWLWDFVTNISV